MIEILSIAAVCFFVGLWCYAIFVVIDLAKKRDELTATWTLVSALPVTIGYLIDVIAFNLILATIIYGELPREDTFSKRVSRKIKESFPRSRIGRARLAFTFWWARQLNALTPSACEHIQNYQANVNS